MNIVGAGVGFAHPVEARRDRQAMSAGQADSRAAHASSSIACLQLGWTKHLGGSNPIRILPPALTAQCFTSSGSGEAGIGAITDGRTTLPICRWRRLREPRCPASPDPEDVNIAP